MRTPMFKYVMGLFGQPIEFHGLFRSWRMVLPLLFLLFFLPLNPIHASLMLAPTRVVFEKNQRAAQIDLVNQSSETETYRIKLVNRRMDEAGGFSAIETPLPGEQFADAMLRYSPRQVVLGPGASQVVRIMVRKPADLAPGEYRSHLLFERVADAAPEPVPSKLTPMPQNATSEGEVELKLTALIGASIPIIIRHGETSATVTLSNLKLEPSGEKGPGALSFELHRNGNRSVYGDLLVNFTPHSGGAEQTVARVNGIAVYTPNLLRRGKIELKPPFVANGRGLHIIYQESLEKGGKPLAEATFP